MANKDKEEKKVLSIIKEDGTKEEVELLICFTFNDTKKEYVVYTRNEKDENGKLIWVCPNCGNKNQDMMSVARRTCGYIGTQFWNQGRTQEIKERVLHL